MFIEKSEFHFGFIVLSYQVDTELLTFESHFRKSLLYRNYLIPDPFACDNNIHPYIEVRQTHLTIHADYSILTVHGCSVCSKMKLSDETNHVCYLLYIYIYKYSHLKNYNRNYILCRAFPFFSSAEMSQTETNTIFTAVTGIFLVQQRMQSIFLKGHNIYKRPTNEQLWLQ